MTRHPSDADARIVAVSGNASYIVQAPAGSGKTELLVQRFLRLLGEVEEPEAILAITFTRKAAAEMRNRIIEAMVLARDHEKPTDAHKASTWELAARALKQDARQRWSLISTPARLRVQTIDSLCAELVQQLPLLTDMGAMPGVIEDATELYLAAAEAALDLEDRDHGDDVATLLAHLEGDMDRAARMLRDMLAQREQWLPHLSGLLAPTRQHFEVALGQLVHSQLQACARALPGAVLTEMLNVGRECAANLDGVGADHPLRSIGPTVAASELQREHWQALDWLFLTRAKVAAVRKQFDRRVGVMADRDSTLKQRVVDVAARLAALDDGPTALRRAALLPTPQYSEQEWRVLSALMRLLKLAAAHLQVEFSARGHTDFAELQTRAIVGLGHADQPSELTLALDYRLAHILIDEFQDTSRAQVRLLTQLTAGWQSDDGRTLFIVGDPMQSIYRFRQAEVGNFLEAQRSGIGDVPLVALRLRANFRSAPAIVEWVNATFATVFPETDDAERGRIAYADADAFVAPIDDAKVNIHPQISHERGDTIEAEVVAVADILRAEQTRSPEGSIAILVRARSHLVELLPYLKQAGIMFQAVEAESLVGRQTVHDLHALFRALTQPADKTAWLAVLRAPWCGLRIAEFHALFGDQNTPSDAWMQLAGEQLDSQVLASLPPESSTRLARTHNAFRVARGSLRAAPLALVVERLWQQLGGPACARNAAELDDANAYLKCLRREEFAGAVVDLARFERQLGKLFAPANAQTDNPVQVMTMHKAKGLEFDTVILPSLGRRPPPRSKPLLAWSERTGEGGRSELLIAPVSIDDQDSGLFDLIYHEDTALEEEESARLLYVGATRARVNLHLLGHTTWSDSEQAPCVPARGSLLARLWPAVAEDYANRGADEQIRADAPEHARPSLRRVTDAWLNTYPIQPPAAPDTESEEDATPELEFDWAGETARHTGTLVHRWLERIANEGVEQWNLERLAMIKRSFGPALTNLGVVPELLDSASERVERALSNTFADETGQWLLRRHPRGAAELALSTERDGNIAAFVVDRTFIDENGVRWIVDYKTGSHEGGDVDAFLASEQARYQSQLEGYARLLSAFEQRETRLALYFPLMKVLRSWSANA